MQEDNNDPANEPPTAILQVENTGPGILNHQDHRGVAPFPDRIHIMGEKTGVTVYLKHEFLFTCQPGKPSGLHNSKVAFASLNCSLAMEIKTQ